MAVIAVTGSVGAGKTTFTNNLARKLKCIPIHLSEVIAKNHLSVGYDKKRSCDIVDIKSLNQFVIRNIIKKAKKDIIIDLIKNRYKLTIELGNNSRHLVFKECCDKVHDLINNKLDEIGELVE